MGAGLSAPPSSAVLGALNVFRLQKRGLHSGPWVRRTRARVASTAGWTPGRWGPRRGGVARLPAGARPAGAGAGTGAHEAVPEGAKQGPQSGPRGDPTWAAGRKRREGGLPCGQCPPFRTDSRSVRPRPQARVGLPRFPLSLLPVLGLDRPPAPPRWPAPVCSAASPLAKGAGQCGGGGGGAELRPGALGAQVSPGDPESLNARGRCAASTGGRGRETGLLGAEAPPPLKIVPEPTKERPAVSRGPGGRGGWKSSASLRWGLCLAPCCAHLVLSSGSGGPLQLRKQHREVSPPAHGHTARKQTR